MSLEQLLGEPLEGRSNLFSLGVVLFEMATGRLPFQGSSRIATAKAILSSEPRDFGESPVPERLKAIVRRLLEREPAKRYASADVLRAELKPLERALSPAGKAGLSKGARAVVAVDVVAVAALAGWYLSLIHI